jgi:hypothetical protein
MTSIPVPPGAGSAAELGAARAGYFTACCLVVLAFLGAVLATAASLGIAAYAGWQRGGLPVERAMNVTLSCVAVLFVHLLPIGWRLVGTAARACAFALWWIGISVVLYGQVTFFVVSGQHAGNERAASVPVSVAPPAANRPPGRTRTEIARDIMKATAELARANASRCEGECPALAVRRATLAARLAALNVESDEAVRREAAYDRSIVQSDRDEALRTALRVDPVASLVASLLHMSASSLELVLAVACSVVLESAAVLGWQQVPVAVGRARGRNMVVSGRKLATRPIRAVAPPSCTGTSEGLRDSLEPAPLASVQNATSTGNDADPVVSEDDQLLRQIQDAVRAGEADPTQESIRRLLRCGQPKAGRLNRLYQERYGCRTPKRVDSQATQLDAPDVAKV